MLGVRGWGERNVQRCRGELVFKAHIEGRVFKEKRRLGGAGTAPPLKPLEPFSPEPFEPFLPEPLAVDCPDAAPLVQCVVVRQPHSMSWRQDKTRHGQDRTRRLVVSCLVLHRPESRPIFNARPMKIGRVYTHPHTLTSTYKD